MPVSMMVPLKVSRSTMAAQSRGSVKVLVQPENDSLEAIAIEFFSSRSVRTWKGSVASVKSKIRQAWSMRRRCRRVPALRSSFAGFRFRVSRTLKGADVGRAAGCGAA